MKEALAENLHREWRTAAINSGLKDRFEPDWSRLSDLEREPWRAVAREAMALLSL